MMTYETKVQMAAAMIKTLSNEEVLNQLSRFSHSEDETEQALREALYQEALNRMNK